MATANQTIAIIVAGGSGSRFGDEVPKQFLSLEQGPLLSVTLSVFEASPEIAGICVVVPADYVDVVSGWRNEYNWKKLQWVVAGGKERQDSMVAGFKAIPPCELVLVHDGARPLVTPEIIERVVEGASERGGVVPGLMVQETLKKVAEGGHVLTTVDRSEYATIQTPQGFRYPLLAEAIDEAQTDGFYGTDESMLIERMGFPVCMVDGSRENIKVTTPQDMQLANTILRRRGGS